MTLAKIVFIIGGIWGIVVLTPLFFLLDITGRQYLPPTSYPHFFYGFFAIAMAWQIAFLLIGTNPMRFRPLMIPCIIEKFAFVATVIVLYSQGHIPSADATVAVPDAILGVLFVVAFLKTSGADRVNRRWE